ncbi:MAG: HNH endonuclease signature motif containing protein [Flavobacteriales bacterium]
MNTIICTIGGDNKLTTPQLIQQYNNWKSKAQNNIQVEWSVIAPKQVQLGDRVFFLKQGEKNANNIIFASGVNISNTANLRYDKEKKKHVYKIDIDIDYMIDPSDYNLGLKRYSGKFSKKFENETYDFWNRIQSGRLLFNTKFINELQNKWNNHKPTLISRPLISTSIITPIPVRVFPKTNFDEEDFQKGINKGKSEKIEVGPIKRKPQNISDTSKPKWKRQKKYSHKALLNAKRKCENQTNHKTFTTRDKETYMEAHHLIPMKCQGDFINSIDIPENIICLCPNCHRMFHSGEMNLTKKLISKFFNKRESNLQNKRDVKITLPKLLKYYNCK